MVSVVLLRRLFNSLFRLTPATAGGNSSSGHMRNQRQSGPLDYNTHYDFQEFYKRHYGAREYRACLQWAVVSVQSVCLFPTLTPDDAAHRERVRRARLAEYEKQMKEVSELCDAILSFDSITATDRFLSSCQ